MGKHVDPVKLRIVVAAVLAVFADTVLVANHLPKYGANCLVTALAHLRVQELALRSSLEAGSMRDKMSGEERRNVESTLWKYGAGNRKCRWCARVYPEL